MEVLNKTKKYRSERYITYSCHYHVIFNTQHFRKIIVGRVKERLVELLLENPEQQKRRVKYRRKAKTSEEVSNILEPQSDQFRYEVLDMLIMPNYLHLLLDVHPKFGVYNAVNRIKGYLHRKLREEFPDLKRKLPTIWTRPKFISTTGMVSLDVTQEYLEDQRRRRKNG